LRKRGSGGIFRGSKFLFLLTALEEKSSIGKDLFDSAKSLAWVIIIALCLRASVVEAFKIPSSSMEPTLQIGDHILVNKLSYGVRLLFFQKESLYQFATPARGDIVVFTQPDDPSTPDDESDTNLIKRVIGLPGDLVEVRGTNLFINGALYKDDSKYAIWQNGGTKNFGPMTVPPGKILLLGDNRDFSRDSRFWDDHFLPVERVKGRAFIIYWNGAMLDRIFTLVR
jgi:signal peptidase I